MNAHAKSASTIDGCGKVSHPELPKNESCATDFELKNLSARCGNESAREIRFDDSNSECFEYVFRSMTQFRTANKVIYQPESTEFTPSGHDELPARGERKEAF
jgi:hypothetical protein